MWAQINVANVFSDFKIESNTDNQIFLEFIPTALSKALRSSQGAASIIIRLAKRTSNNTPILSFAFSGATRGGHSLDIVQEMSVRVLKLTELEEMAKEPMCPEPDVHIMLPLPSETMRGVVERMKNLDSLITVSANLQGIFRLRVNSDLANVETEWRNLKHPEIGGYSLDNASVSVGLMKRFVDIQASQNADEIDPSAFHAVAIEAKHLLKLLSALSNGNHTIACKLILVIRHNLFLKINCTGICSNHCLIAYLYVGEAKESHVESASILTFFVPGHTDGE